MRIMSAWMVFHASWMVGVVAGPASAEEMVSNPLYEYWASFKPGATATHLETTTLTGEDRKLAPDGKDVKRVMYELVRVTDKAVVVKTVVEERLFLRTVRQPATRITFPAKVKKSILAAAKEAVGADVGEATISVNGQEMKCKTFAGTMKDGDQVVNKKLWFSEKVPGGIVKEIATTKVGGELDGEVLIELESFSVAD